MAAASIPEAHGGRYRVWVVGTAIGGWNTRSVTSLYIYHSHTTNILRNRGMGFTNVSFLVGC